MNEENRFKETGPQTFQEGDIVELQVSFIVVPLREQKSRMNVVLRSITLLEGKYTQVWTIVGTPIQLCLYIYSIYFVGRFRQSCDSWERRQDQSKVNR